jgi:hypothetical protein
MFHIYCGECYRTCKIEHVLGVISWTLGQTGNKIILDESHDETAYSSEQNIDNDFGKKELIDEIFQYHVDRAYPNQTLATKHIISHCPYLFAYALSNESMIKLAGLDVNWKESIKPTYVEAMVKSVINVANIERLPSVLTILRDNFEIDFSIYPLDYIQKFSSSMFSKFAKKIPLLIQFLLLAVINLCAIIFLKYLI